VNTDIRRVENSGNARSSRGEDRDYRGRVGNRGLKVKTQGVTDPNGSGEVKEG
jgi:hypothetical protein